MEDKDDIAFADTIDALEMTPDIIVKQLEASAMEYYRLEKFDRARDYLEQLVMMRPHEASYWTLLGVIYRRRKRRGSALQCFKRAAEIDPEDLNTLVNFGETLLEVGKVPAGVDLLRAVFDKGYDPSKPPEEQDEFTIRAGAMLEFVQKSINGFIEHERERHSEQN